MPTFDDVARLALAMPDAVERPVRDLRAWRVKDKLFVWERPLRGSDLAALGDAVPGGTILGVRTDGLGEKEALLQSEPELFFTIPHFENYPAVLLRLEVVSGERLAEAVEDAWLARAPKRLVTEYLAR